MKKLFIILMILGFVGVVIVTTLERRVDISTIIDGGVVSHSTNAEWEKLTRELDEKYGKHGWKYEIRWQELSSPVIHSIWYAYKKQWYWLGVAWGNESERFSPEWHNSAEWYRSGDVQWAVFPDGHIEAFYIEPGGNIIEITGAMSEKIKTNYKRDKDKPDNERESILKEREAP